MVAVVLEVVGLVVVGGGGRRRRRHVDPPLLPLPDGAVEGGGRRPVPGGGSAQSRPGSFHSLFSVRPPDARKRYEKRENFCRACGVAAAAKDRF